MDSKKWKLPSKEELIIGIQFALILYMTTAGFIFTYLLLWWAIDALPKNQYAVLSCVVAGILSMGGLFSWIQGSTNREISKKEMCENAKSICNNQCDSCAWNE